jgi:hypothetical protein
MIRLEGGGRRLQIQIRQCLVLDQHLRLELLRLFALHHYDLRFFGAGYGLRLSGAQLLTTSKLYICE